jgi:hypothetical protein
VAPQPLDACAAIIDGGLLGASETDYVSKSMIVTSLFCIAALALVQKYQLGEGCGSRSLRQGLSIQNALQDQTVPFLCRRCLFAPSHCIALKTPASRVLEVVDRCFE